MFVNNITNMKNVLKLREKIANTYEYISPRKYFSFM